MQPRFAVEPLDEYFCTLDQVFILEAASLPTVANH